MSKYFRFCCCITQKKLEILQKTIDISAILPYIVELSRPMHFLHFDIYASVERAKSQGPFKPIFWLWDDPLFRGGR